MNRARATAGSRSPRRRTRGTPSSRAAVAGLRDRTPGGQRGSKVSVEQAPAQCRYWVGPGVPALADVPVPPTAAGVACFPSFAFAAFPGRICVAAKTMIEIAISVTAASAARTKPHQATRGQPARPPQSTRSAHGLNEVDVGEVAAIVIEIQRPAVLLEPADLFRVGVHQVVEQRDDVAAGFEFLLASSSCMMSVRFASSCSASAC